MISSVKSRGSTTMKSFQPPPQGREAKVIDKCELEEKQDIPLEQNFKILEQEWSFFKQMNPRKSQCSDDFDVTNDCLQQSVIESSPREVMSSFLQQRRRLPSEGHLREWRHNDRAVVEILRDRWDAIQSGKLKRRRLFEDLSSGETEEDVYGFEATESQGGLVSTCGSDVNENGNMSINVAWNNCKESLGYCCSSSSEYGERVVPGKEEATETENVTVKRGSGGMVGWLCVVIAWLGVIFAVCIVSRKSNGGYVQVPT